MISPPKALEPQRVVDLRLRLCAIARFRCSMWCGDHIDPAHPPRAIGPEQILRSTLATPRTLSANELDDTPFNHSVRNAAFRL